MYIITGRLNDVIFATGRQLDYMENGYPRLVEENRAFIKEDVNVYSTDSVPSHIAPVKYCYTREEGYYENPGYIEMNKWGLPEETVQAIKDEAITEVQKGVANG